MNFFQNLLCVNYSSHGLSSIEQLIFIKIAYGTFYNTNLTSKHLCDSCGCSKPTLHLSISNLEKLDLIGVVRKSGFPNIYSLGNSYIISSLSSEVSLNESLHKVFKGSPLPILTKNKSKNQRKRSKKSKRR